MPISPIVLQRRHAELGRIRLGATEAITKRNGDPGTRPLKLQSFRFTSPSERYIRDLAELYGGDPRSWDNNGKPEWEVYTQAKSIPVIAVKGGLSQWMETWSGGGCIHRCDGERGADGDLCNPDDRAHQDAKPTTRLSVMLPELEAIGVWRMESHGWNAAAEIPAVAELAQYVGDLVPAHLHLIERRTVKDGKTSRFVVPVLDLQIGTARLKEIVAEKSGQALQVEGTAKAQLEAGPSPNQHSEYPDYIAQARAARTLDEWRAVWNACKDAGHGTPELVAELTAIGERLRNPVAPAEDTGEVVDAEPVEDPDVTWQRILTVAGNLDMDLSMVEQDFASLNDGTFPDSATGEQLDAYLTDLRGRAVT